ncbi:MAG: hypothetical protein ABI183_12710, partial [Polyangiaceae bacterium]
MGNQLNVFGMGALLALAACGRLTSSQATSSNDPTAPPSSIAPPSSSTPTDCPNQRIAVEGEPEVQDLALDATYVYLLETVYPTSDTASTAIRRESRCNGTITTIASSPQNPAQIAMDSTNIYWVTSNANFGADASSALLQMPKSGGAPVVLRSSTTAEGAISAVAASDGSLVWVEAGALRSSSGVIAPAPKAKGKILRSGSIVFIPEYDNTSFTFDVRRIDLENPGTPVIYPGADASAAMAIFQGNLYVDGAQTVELVSPKSAITSSLGRGFAMTA